MYNTYKARREMICRQPDEDIESFNYEVLTHEGVERLLNEKVDELCKNLKLPDEKWVCSSYVKLEG